MALRVSKYQHGAFMVSVALIAQSAVAREVQALRDRVEELEDLIGLRVPAPRSDMPHLTGIEYKLAGVLLRGGIVSQEYALRAIYGARPEADHPEVKIIDVFICELRKKLRPFDIEIKNQFAVGFYLDDKSRAKLKALFGGAT